MEALIFGIIIPYGRFKILLNEWKSIILQILKCNRGIFMKFENLANDD